MRTGDVIITIGIGVIGYLFWQWSQKNNVFGTNPLLKGLTKTTPFNFPKITVPPYLMDATTTNVLPLLTPAKKSVFKLGISN